MFSLCLLSFPFFFFQVDEIHNLCNFLLAFFFHKTQILLNVEEIGRIKMESSAHRVLNTRKGEATALSDLQKQIGYVNDASKMKYLWLCYGEFFV